MNHDIIIRLQVKPDADLAGITAEITKLVQTGICSGDFGNYPALWHGVYTADIELVD